MNRNTYSILLAAEKMGPMTPTQFSRFLFDSSLVKEFDLAAALSELRKAGLLAQGVSQSGITYLLTEAGGEELSKAEAADDATLALYEEAAASYTEIFEKEKDLIAQYTEGATGNCPVFLSIREDNHVLLHISIEVPDTATAQRITKNWVKNSRKAYDAVWDAIAEGAPKAPLKTI